MYSSLFQVGIGEDSTSSSSFCQYSSQALDVNGKRLCKIRRPTWSGLVWTGLEGAVLLQMCHRNYAAIDICLFQKDWMTPV